MRKLSILILLGLFTISVSAQETSVDSTATPDQKEEKVSAFSQYEGEKAIALNFGVIGGGLEYAHNITKHINLRGRLTYFSLSDQEFTIDLSGEELLGTLGGDVVIADLLFEYLPFERSSFKLVGGLSYLFNYDANLTANFTESVSYGEVVLQPEDMGGLGINVDWSGFAPYAGLGIGRAVPKKRMGFGFEIGTHYASAPDLDLTATGAISGTADENQSTLKEDLSEYRWLPFLQFRLSYKL